MPNIILFYLRQEYTVMTRQLIYKATFPLYGKSMKMMNEYISVSFI